MTQTHIARSVKKNSKEFSVAISSASHVRIFSLDNGFNGASAETFPKWVDEFRLYATDGGYKAYVHSNLWIEFKGAA